MAFSLLYLGLCRIFGDHQIEQSSLR
jgi:hypothetical protein